MSKVEHASLVAATHADAAVSHGAMEPAGARALPFDAALDKAAADLARGLFRPQVFSAVSLAALAFAAFQVVLYLAA